MMLTGDNKATAKWVSDQLGLDEYFAEVLPQDKASKVKEVQSRGVMAAMTGDGVNGTRQQAVEALCAPAYGRCMVRPV